MCVTGLAGICATVCHDAAMNPVEGKLNIKFINRVASNLRLANCRKNIVVSLTGIYRGIFVYIFPFISICAPVSNKVTKTEALYIESVL